MPATLQFLKDGKRLLQRWDRLTDEQQNAVLQSLAAKGMTPAQKTVLAALGEVVRVFVRDVDGEYINEDVVSGKSYKRGNVHSTPARSLLKKRGVSSGNR
jgi:hypothetical protein